MQAFLPHFLEFANSHILEGVNLFNYNRMESMIAQSGKTKLHLCRAMGVSKTYLRDAKKQGTDISGEKLHILAAELNTTPEYLRGETDDPGIKKETPAHQMVDERLDPNTARLIELYSQLSEKYRELYLQQLETLVLALQDGEREKNTQG